MALRCQAAAQLCTCSPIALSASAAVGGLAGAAGIGLGVAMVTLARWAASGGRMPSVPDSKSLLPAVGAVPVLVAFLTGGVTVAGPGLSGSLAAREADMRGNSPCRLYLTAKIAETIRNIPATPAENHRSVWLAERAFAFCGRCMLLDAEFMGRSRFESWCTAF